MAKDNAVGSIVGIGALALVGYYVLRTVLPKIQANAAVAKSQAQPQSPGYQSPDRQLVLNNALQSIQNAIDAANNNAADGRSATVDAKNEATSGLSAIYYDPTIVQGT